ncbi:MAG: FliH/SctL family protein [Pseudomonadota bacterium]
MSASHSAFAALSRSREFHRLGLTPGPREGTPAHQPLPVQRGPVAPLGAPRTDCQPGDPDAPPAPAAPTREELAAAEQARARAEQTLAASQAEQHRLRAQLEEERARTRELAAAFDRGLSESRQELRQSYARLVMQGCRRLVGALSQHEAVFSARLEVVAEQLVLENEVILKVAPRNKKNAEAAVFGRAGWLVEIDPSMDAGCVALCRNATVDARMETAFEGLDRALEAWVQDDGPSEPGR